ncbi:hypothetical protein [Streptomyces sp. NPDC049881]|uniref:hypothetical protein n=1 Tax=unclassified Streptomyces TaxID=2593676 RepID=UPI0034214FEE
MPSPREPDLSVQEAELAPIREDADRLGRIATEGGRAAGSTYDAVADLRAAGLASGDALHHAMWRFTQQSLALSRDCDRIAGHLTTTVASHAGLEGDVVTGLNSAITAL